jgi:tetratricopeptide (TPR) repeat protein
MMINSKRAIALAVAFGGLAAAPALAQYQPAPQQQPVPQTNAGSAQAAPAAEGRKYALSNSGRKAIVALQAAVNAKDAAAISAAVAEANAAAKTKDDRYVVGQLRLKAALDAKDSAGITAALEAMLASGGATQDELVPLHTNLGKQFYAAKQYDRAAAEFEKAITIDPSNSDATVMLAEARKAQGRGADAVALLQKGIAAKVAAGQKAPEEWYKRAVALAFEAKMPTANQLSRDWVAAYPTPTNWRDTLRLYQTTSGADSDMLIDMQRLQRATGSLAGEGDFYRYASSALAKGFPGEAKAVLDEGIAAKKINGSAAMFRDVLAAANGKVAADRASLAGLEKSALASVAARQAMVTGDAYLGYGEYAKAASLYRAALTKSGVDANLANLRLGIALARVGDNAGAAVALRAVSGPRADIAKYWLLYLSTRV